MPKSRTKSRKPGKLVPQPHGGAIKQGGTNPNAGRPPDEFRQMCQALATRGATVAAVTAILEDPSHTHYMSALKWATEHGYGKPKETHDHNVTLLTTEERERRIAALVGAGQKRLKAR